MWNLMILLAAVLLYCYKSQFYQMVAPVSYSVSLPDKFDGALSINEKLDKIDRLHENVIYWPESMAVHKGNIYTGLGDGRIVQISPNKVTEICRIGTSCGGVHEEHICGRPLGMRFNKEGKLYVADAYHGLFVVDVGTGQKKQILPSTTLVDNKPLTFLNSLALDEKEEVVYLSQSSTKWNISMVVVSTLEHDATGRLLKYDLKTKKVSVLKDGLAFPNGIEMTLDGSALLVAEMLKNSIFKYTIKGASKGQQKVVCAALPGEPDNISRNIRGNFWVGINNGRTKESPTIYDRVSEQPFFRTWFLHIHRLSTFPISALLKLFPQTKDMAFELQNGRIFASLFKSHGVIVEIDESGKILQSLHSPSGNVAHISEVLEHNGYLYLGSWRNHYLGRLKI